jgi:HTH-type transcriptional regulator, competence development regulator
MNKLGELIRTHREANNMFLRHLAAKLDMDTAQLSKIERGERIAKREHIESLSKIFGLNSTDLLTYWFSDQILDLVHQEDVAKEALELSLKELKQN